MPRPAKKVSAPKDSTATIGFEAKLWLVIECFFDEFTAPLMTKIKANLHQSRALATLRDTLLPKLLSGELSVADTELLK